MNDFSLPALGIFQLSSSSKDASGTEDYNFKCKTSYHIQHIRLRIQTSGLREIYLESTSCSSLIRMMQASNININHDELKLKDLNYPYIYTYSTYGLNAIKVAQILFETIILEK